MGWPQIVWIALTAANVGIISSKHGEPKTGKYNFWIALADAGLSAFLLYKGGFFG